MKGLTDYVLAPLTFIGAINWGLVGIFGFDLVAWLFGPATLVSNIVYAIIVGGKYTVLFTLDEKELVHQEYGKTLEKARKLLDDAKAVEEAGAFAVTLECVPEALAKMITEQSTILTIGIGASSSCDGQVLVYQDMLGYSNGFVPKFVKKYADVHSVMLEAFKQYKLDCEARTFPAENHTYAISDEVLERLKIED